MERCVASLIARHPALNIDIEDEYIMYDTVAHHSMIVPLLNSRGGRVVCIGVWIETQAPKCVHRITCAFV
jgi:hypothetical protein